MTIDEAIKILDKHIDTCTSAKEVDTYNALLLGLNALKNVKAFRLVCFAFPISLLPGETKE